MSQYTAINGLGTAFWRDLNVADNIAVYNPGNVATSVNGLWSITLAAGTLTTWEFAPIPVPLPNRCVLLVKFSQFTHPALNLDIVVMMGGGNGAVDLNTSGIACGYYYPTGTVNMQGHAYTSAHGGNQTTALARATVTQVDGAIFGNANGGTATEISAAMTTLVGVTSPSVGQVHDSTEGGAAGLPWSTIQIAAGFGGPGVDQTVGFRPQYAVINLTSL